LDRPVDLAAVNRVAKRVELKGVRLSEISAKCDPTVIGPSLMPNVDLDCKVGEHNESSLEVICNYTFAAQSEGKQVIQSTITYLLSYEVSGSESPSAEDLTEFAKANGALHSWPFVRELLYGLTSRMGYPPYTLPVIHFSVTKTPAKVQEKEPLAEPIEAQAEAPKTKK
jgi:preprotein translocase subunit SecB